MNGPAAPDDSRQRRFGVFRFRVARGNQNGFRPPERAIQLATALKLMRLPRIGISRASKILALSDQSEFGIYDSRSAHGLSDFEDHAGRRIIPIPSGRAIHGDSRDKGEFCQAFEEYNWVLRRFYALAQGDASLRVRFSSVAEVEMAFFMRSRSGRIKAPATADPVVPDHLRSVAELNEEDLLDAWCRWEM